MAEKSAKENKEKPKSTFKTVDPAAQQLIDYAADNNISTAFDRAAHMRPCPIGLDGACCKHCWMGPCRFVGKNAEEVVGVCGASLATISSRNFARAVAAGTAAHSDHGRDIVITLRAVAKGEVSDYHIKDEMKLRKVAQNMNIPEEGRTKEEVALDVATKALEDFGRQEGELTYLSTAPAKRQEIWRNLGIAPRGIDREVSEMMHRTNMGVDQDHESLLKNSLKTALADGWGGSMLATDLSDILFGTPSPLNSNVNLGVLQEDKVNVVVHGHEPLLAEMLAIAASDKELIDYAKTKGAKGIVLSGICCTANEILMRKGIPAAGNFLHQELAILTGAVEAMVVDVQCIFQALAELSKKYHTKIITTSKKAHIPGAKHIQFDQVLALEIAKQIIREAVDNFPNRKGKVRIPQHKSDLIAGFSHEYIRYMLGGKYRESFRPLNDAIIDGRIMGAVGIVGCNNPRLALDDYHEYLTREFIKNDILVVQTGCAAIGAAKYGFMTPEAMEATGPGLRSICEAVGMPPVLHLGSCVDNSRILTILTEVANEGGLGEDISDLPVVGIAPEWMSEKALAIGTYFVASGVYTIFGGKSPVVASSKSVNYMLDGWEELVGGKMEFIETPEEIVKKSIEHINKKRKALGIDIKKERVLFGMEDRRNIGFQSQEKCG